MNQILRYVVYKPHLLLLLLSLNGIHVRTTLSSMYLWTDPTGVTALPAIWTEKLAGGPQVGRSDSPPPTSKGHESG